MNNKDKKVIGYDKDTGFPIYDNSKVVEQPVNEKTTTMKKIVGYDANTGFPIYEDVVVVNNSQNNRPVEWSLRTIISVFITVIPWILMTIYFVVCPQPDEMKNNSSGVSFVFLYILVIGVFIFISLLCSLLIVFNRHIDKKNARENTKSPLGVVINVLAVIVLAFVLTFAFKRFYDRYQHFVDENQVSTEPIYIGD